jgi:hypothetical protein
MAEKPQEKSEATKTEDTKPEVKTLPAPTMSPKAASQEAISLEEELISLSEMSEDFVELKYQERAEYLQFRRRWSMALLGVVYIIVFFDILFLLAVGSGILQYQDEWLVRLIFVGNFIEVVGLARIVVDFLFKEPPSKL